MLCHNDGFNFYCDYSKRWNGNPPLKFITKKKKGKKNRIDKFKLEREKKNIEIG